jgi:hypothetical protein
MSLHGFVAEDLPASRYWRQSEVRILRAIYPAGGAGAVQALLPHRSLATIRVNASQRGIRRQHP